MTVSYLIETQRDKILRDWDIFISNFAIRPADEDIASLRLHIVDLITFCKESLKSRLSEELLIHCDALNDEVRHFFHARRDYISLRLECGFLLTDVVKEIIVLRQALQRGLIEISTQVNVDLKISATLNNFLDKIIHCAMDEYSILAKISRQRFLTTINHDTRSPLFAISLGVRHLLKESSLSKDIARTANLVSKSAELALSRISDYHDFNAVELGQSILLTPEPVDMTSLCAEVVEEIRQLFPDFVISSKIPEDVWGTWDRSRIRQAIYIVLLNAIQSSEDSRHIDVHVSSTNDTIAIDIFNAQGKIVDQLERVIYNPIMLNSMRIENKINLKENEQNRMGLYLAREIISSHIGSLKIDQIPEKGIRFGISIPRNLLEYGPNV